MTASVPVQKRGKEAVKVHNFPGGGETFGAKYTKMKSEIRVEFSRVTVRKTFNLMMWTNLREIVDKKKRL